MDFTYDSDELELPLMHLMNCMAFESGEKGRKFDANFISHFNSKTKEFEYYIQRLAGKEIENDANPCSGKIWVPYLNNRREDWSYLCENNRIVSKKD